MAIITLKDPQVAGVIYQFDTNGEVLGEGGMGRVYLGKRISPNGHALAVAIKEIKSKEIDIIERARREANIQLTNDHLVRMYGMIETRDSGPLNDTCYYVISEFIEGILLDEAIQGNLKDRNGKIHPAIQKFYDDYTNDRDRTATEVVKSVLSGLMALHDAGYLHRDIDPTNIMISSQGKVKLIDFGIAKKLDNINERLTTPGVFMGKAHYAAPELVMGDVASQRFPTDIYAVGILYFQLITGHLPFDGPAYEVSEMQKNKRMPLKEIKNKEIRAIIEKATEKKVADRYASSALFRAAIDTVMYDTSSGNGGMKWVYGILGLLVLGGLGWWWLSGQKGAPEADELLMRCQSDSALLYNENPESQQIGCRDLLVLVDSGVPAAAQLLDTRLQGLVAVIDQSADEAEVKTAYRTVEAMAKSGYPQAMYEVAFSLAPAISSERSQSDHRKQVLGFSTEPSSTQMNEAKEWLTQLIAKQPDHYKGLYLLANLLYQQSDANIPETIRLSEQSLEAARKAGDNAYAGKVSTALEILRNI